MFTEIRRDNLEVPILYVYQLGPALEFKSLGLSASTFTPEPSYFMNNL